MQIKPETVSPHFSEHKFTFDLVYYVKIKEAFSEKWPLNFERLRDDDCIPFSLLHLMFMNGTRFKWEFCCRFRCRKSILFQMIFNTKIYWKMVVLRKRFFFYRNHLTLKWKNKTICQFLSKHAKHFIPLWGMEEPTKAIINASISIK